MSDPFNGAPGSLATNRGGILEFIKPAHSKRVDEGGGEPRVAFDTRDTIRMGGQFSSIEDTLATTSITDSRQYIR